MHLNESTRLRERRERLPELMVEEKRERKVLKLPNGRGRPEEGFPAVNLGGGGRARGGECGGRGGGGRMKNYPSTPNLTPHAEALSGSTAGPAVVPPALVLPVARGATASCDGAVVPDKHR